MTYLRATVITTQNNNVIGRHYKSAEVQEEWLMEEAQLVLKGEL